MKNFIMIDNDMLLNNNNFNTFKKIGTEGFALYCYLLVQQGQRSCSQTTVKMIYSFMNRDIENNKKLNYDKDKFCNVSTMKDKKTIIKYLNILDNAKLIIIKDKKNYGLNDILIIETKKIETTNFTMISEDLFINYIYKIGHIGWSLLYILTKLHNKEFGSCSSEGFANPSESYLSNITKKNVKTIRAYLYLLEKYKLIKIEPQTPIYRGLDKYGSDFYEFLPNNYIVKNKLVNNKYYIDRKE